nr:LPXTG cell wall anchor domain-containing protein [Lactobacillus helveticus]
MILAEKVTVDSKDESYTVDYTPETKPGETTIDPSEIGQPATIIIQYKDADEDNKDLSTQTFTGKVGEKVDWLMGDGYIHLNIPEHYTLAPNNKNTYPSKFGKTSQTIPVYLKHEITPGYDHKDNPDVYREVKETVVVTEPTDSGTATMTTGTAIVLYRDIDEVTNRPVGNWQNLTDFNGDKKGDTNFEAIKVDPIEGYTASVTKNGQPISITDNEISSSELSALVNGEPAANITIEVKYDKEGSTNPGTGDDQKGDNPGKGEDTPSTDDQDLTIVYGISDQNNHDLYRDIIRTINQHMPDGQVNKMRQGIVFYRNAYKNKAGKIVKYDQWQSTSRTNTLAAMTIPGAGDAYKITYTEDGKQIDGIKEVKVTPDTKSSVIDVNYVPVEQKFVLNYVDKNDPKHVVGHQDILGKIGETVVIDKMNIPKGWTEVPGQLDYNNYHYKFGSKLPEPKNILVEHKIDEISGLQDKNNPELYREVTRTVNITYPDGQTGTGKQQIVFYRIKQVDEAENNKTTFSPWTSNSVNANTDEDIIQYGLLPLHPVKGYTIVAKDGDQLLTINSKDQLQIQSAFNDQGEPINRTITVTYVKSGSTADPTQDPNTIYSRQITYVSSENKDEVVGTQTIKGKLGEHIPVKLEIPAGWKLAKGVDAPTSVVITQDDDTPITIALDKIVKPDSGPTGSDKHEGGKPGTGQQGGNHNEGGTGSQGSGNSDQGNISGGTTGTVAGGSASGAQSTTGSTSSTTSSTTAATGTDTKTAIAASQSDTSSDDSDLDDEDYDDDSGDVEAPRHHKSGKSRSSRRAAASASGASASAAPAAAARSTAAASCYASNIGPHGQSSTAGSSSNIAPNGEALPDGQSINAKGQVLDAKGQVIGYVYKNGQVHYYSLPQTGEKQNDLAAILGASAIAISMIGLAGVKKRRNN